MTARPELLDLPAGLLRVLLLFGQVSNGRVGALAREQHRRGRPDAAVAARDDGLFALELVRRPVCHHVALAVGGELVARRLRVWHLVLLAGELLPRYGDLALCVPLESAADALLASGAVRALVELRRHCECDLCRSSLRPGSLIEVESRGLFKYGRNFVTLPSNGPFHPGTSSIGSSMTTCGALSQFGRRVDGIGSRPCSALSSARDSFMTRKITARPSILATTFSAGDGWAAPGRPGSGSFAGGLRGSGQGPPSPSGLSAHERNPRSAPSPSKSPHPDARGLFAMKHSHFGVRAVDLLRPMKRPRFVPVHDQRSFACPSRLSTQ